MHSFDRSSLVFVGCRQARCSCWQGQHASMAAAESFAFDFACGCPHPLLLSIWRYRYFTFGSLRYRNVSRRSRWCNCTTLTGRRERIVLPRLDTDTRRGLYKIKGHALTPRPYS